MPEQMQLADILNDKPVEKPAAEAPPSPPAAPAPEAPAKDQVEKQQAERNEHRSIRQTHRDVEQAAQGRKRDPETGQFVAATEVPEAPKEPAKPEAVAAKPTAPAAPPAPPAQEFTDKEKAFLRAAQQERAKRQELERRLAAMGAAQAQAAPAATAEPAKTFWDDPEGALSAHQAEIRKEVIHARLDTTEAIARSKHADFDEKIQVFQSILQSTPGLVQQWLASPDPAEFAYGLGKNHMHLQAAFSIEGLRAQIEKETRIKLEAELREKADALAKERAALPPSLSEARASGVNKPVWSGPTPLDAIIGKS